MLTVVYLLFFDYKILVDIRVWVYNIEHEYSEHSKYDESFAVGDC